MSAISLALNQSGTQSVWHSISLALTQSGTQSVWHLVWQSISLTVSQSGSQLDWQSISLAGNKSDCSQSVCQQSIAVKPVWQSISLAVQLSLSVSLSCSQLVPVQSVPVWPVSASLAVNMPAVSQSGSQSVWHSVSLAVSQTDCSQSAWLSQSAWTFSQPG